MVGDGYALSELLDMPLQLFVEFLAAAVKRAADRRLEAEISRELSATNWSSDEQRERNKRIRKLIEEQEKLWLT